MSKCPKCPKCGSDAYLGFVAVECAGKKCANFSQKFYDENMPAPYTKIKMKDLAPKTSQPLFKFSIGDKVTLYPNGHKYTIISGSTVKGITSYDARDAYGKIYIFSEDELVACPSSPLVIPNNATMPFVVGSIVVMNISGKNHYSMVKEIRPSKLNPLASLIITEDKNGQKRYFYEDDPNVQVVPFIP